MVQVDDLKGMELDAWVFKALGYAIERHGDSKDRPISGWWYKDTDLFARMPPPFYTSQPLRDRAVSEAWAWMGDMIDQWRFEMFMDQDQYGTWVVAVNYNSVIGVANDDRYPMPAFAKAVIKCVYGDEVDEETLFSGPTQEWRREETPWGVSDSDAAGHDSSHLPTGLVERVDARFARGS